MDGASTSSALVVDAPTWLRQLTGTTPQTSTGWFRAGVGTCERVIPPLTHLSQTLLSQTLVPDPYTSARCIPQHAHTPHTNFAGFYRKRYHNPAVQCLEKAVELDPLNFNAHQVLARAYVLQNRRADAIASLQKSVRLNNNSDWQLLIELTNLEEQAAASKDD